MFRVKMNPVIVEAKQYQVGREQEIIDWLRPYGFSLHVGSCAISLGGRYGRPGDWIIHSIEGRFFICPSDQFESLYVKENADVAV